MSKLLAVIDMQNDFVTGSLGTDEAKRIVSPVCERIQKAERDKYHVVYTQDTHNQDYLSTTEGINLPIIHCVENTAGWDFIPEIKPYVSQRPVFNKSTFGSTDLGVYIKDHHFNEVELIGLCTDICIISNALLIKAFVPDINISVNQFCCAGVTPSSHKNALEAMKMCHIKII